MKTQTYYRYYYGRTSVFSAVTMWFNRQTDKRAGTPEWMREYDDLVEKIDKNEEWLPAPALKRGCRFYFTKLGSEKYKNTRLRMDKQILNPEKIYRKDFRCFEKRVGGRRFLYDFSNKRRVGEIIYEDKYQIAVSKN